MIISQAAQPSGKGAGKALILAMMHDAVVAGTWALQATAVGIFDVGAANGTFSNTATNAQNDGLQYKIFLNAGTWRVRYYGYTNNTCGKFHVLVDGSDVATIDLYTAAGAINTINGSSFIVGAAGYKTVQFVLADKNAASSDYYAYPSFFEFEETA